MGKQETKALESLSSSSSSSSSSDSGIGLEYHGSETNANYNESWSLLLMLFWCRIGVEHISFPNYAHHGAQHFLYSFFFFL